MKPIIMEWTKKQEIVALYLYCIIPFNKVNNSNRQIALMAELIGRPNANSLKAKIGNFGCFDSNLSASGLGHSSRLDETVWNEYNGRWQELEIDALRLIEEYQSARRDINPDIPSIPIGRERETVIKQRTNQYLFRNMVLSAYNNSCCITGLARQELVEACHIINWSDDNQNRLNPCNGLAMNTLFHKAYDKYYLGITPDCTVVISDRLYDGLSNDGKDRTYGLFNPYNKVRIIMPRKFKPDNALLEKKFNLFRVY